MTLKRHGIGITAALSTFWILTLMSGTAGLIALYASGALLLAGSGLYFYYHRLARPQRDLANAPVGAFYAGGPGNDPMRMPPKAIQMLVTLRDKGKCRIKYPGICTGQLQTFDHVIPWSKGGSSRDPRNIQGACTPCNQHKSDKILPEFASAFNQGRA